MAKCTLITLSNDWFIRIESDRTIIITDTVEIIHGKPQNTPEYLNTAEALGYGNDIAAMCRDHDPLHAIIGCALYGKSYSLMDAAGIALDPFERTFAEAEEVAVMANQRLMRLKRMNALQVGLRLGVVTNVEWVETTDEEAECAPEGE